jgi:salicylate 5-hydroxylase small subunit
MISKNVSILDIIALYADYAACLDEERFDDWTTLFTEDCIYKVIPRENYEAGRPLAIMSLKGAAGLKDRVYGVTSTVFHAPYYQRHIIGLPRVTGEIENGVRTEANYLVLRTKRDALSEVYNTGRYRDHIVRTPEGLRFSEKLCIFDSELIPNSMIYPL